MRTFAQLVAAIIRILPSLLLPSHLRETSAVQQPAHKAGMHACGLSEGSMDRSLEFVLLLTDSMLQYVELPTLHGRRREANVREIDEC